MSDPKLLTLEDLEFLLRKYFLRMKQNECLDEAHDIVHPLLATAIAAMKVVQVSADALRCLNNELPWCAHGCEERLIKALKPFQKSALEGGKEG